MSALIAFLAQRRKTWAALAAVLLSWSLLAYFPDGVVTRGEWAVLLVGLSGVFGVHSIGNDPLSPATDAYQPLFDDTPAPPAVPLAADYPSQPSGPDGAVTPLSVIPSPPAAPVPIAA